LDRLRTQPGIKAKPPGQRQAVPRSDASATERFLLREEVFGSHKARRMIGGAPARGLTLVQKSNTENGVSIRLNFFDLALDFIDHKSSGSHLGTLKWKSLTKLLSR